MTPDETFVQYVKIALAILAIVWFSAWIIHIDYLLLNISRNLYTVFNEPA